MEKKINRKERFQNGDSVEYIETLLNSIDNYLNNEIRLACNNQQFILMILGIHAVSLTISEVFFSLNGLDGYKAFLTKFVDDSHVKFSEIADKIHGFRNNVAHQWLASLNHEFGFNIDMRDGYKKEDGIIYLNPRIYCEKYLKCFSNQGKLWDYKKILSDLKKNKIIEKFDKN